MVAFAENKIPRTACSKLPQHLRGLNARLVEKSIYRDDLETENYYMHNRCYSPALGRWLTHDPIGVKGGINLYAYVGSSPVRNVDAAGLVWYEPWTWGGGETAWGCMGDEGIVNTNDVNAAAQAVAQTVSNGGQELGQLAAPAANYVLTTPAYPGNKMLGLPTGQGLAWGQGSLDVGFIKGSRSFQVQDRAWLQSIVSKWSLAQGCSPAKGKIHEGAVFPASLFKPGYLAYNVAGQLAIGRFVVHAFAIGAIHQRCHGRGVSGGASLTVRYTVTDPFHLHLATWEPGRFSQVVHWTGSTYIPIDHKC